MVYKKIEKEVIKHAVFRRIVILKSKLNFVELAAPSLRVSITGRLRTLKRGRTVAAEARKPIERDTG